jgi:hypothetical protein
MKSTYKQTNILGTGDHNRMLLFHGPINQSNQLPSSHSTIKQRYMCNAERTQCANLADSGERVSEPVEGLICRDQPQADLKLRRG